MKILKIDPGEKPKVMEIDGDLESMQAVVGGFIEAIYPFDDAVALICNGEAKLDGMEPNRALRNPKNGEIYDVVCGPMFLCGAPADSDSFTDLTPEQLTYYQNYYEAPELFLRVAGALVVLKA